MRKMSKLSDPWSFGNVDRPWHSTHGYRAGNLIQVGIENANARGLGSSNIGREDHHIAYISPSIRSHRDLGNGRKVVIYRSIRVGDANSTIRYVSVLIDVKHCH